MSYRLGPTRLVNFGPFEDVSFDLSKPGLTCIEGEFVGHGCDDNGSGKSYLFDGIVWLLYDRVIRERVAKDGVVRLLFDAKGNVRRDKKDRPLIPAGGCWGELHIVGGPRTILVRRYRAHSVKGNRVEMYVDGKDVTQGRDSMTNLAIERELGLDYATFVRSVAFGAGDDAKSFFSAPERERKGIMERILGLEVYGGAEKIARARARTLATELADSERERERLLAKIEEQEGALARLLRVDDIEERKRELTISRGNLRAMENGRVQRQSAVDEAQGDLDEEHEAAQAMVDAYEAERLAYVARRSELERAVRTQERKQAEYTAEVRHLERQISKWEAMSGRKCPECTQVVPVQAGQKLVSRLKSARDAQLGEVAEAEAALGALQLQVGELREPVRPKAWTMEGARAALARAEEALDDLDRKIVVARRDVAHLERAYEEAQARSETVERQIAKLRGSLGKLDDETQSKRDELARVEFWVHGFGNAGIKSFLIEAQIPALNRVAVTYATKLLGPGAFVRLRATRDLKSGGQREEMSVEGSIPGCCSSYANASKGQKRRLDLCLLLAFRDVVSVRAAKAVDQLLVDELFDGMDRTGEEYVVELLADLSAKCPVALVTHSQTLRSVGDRVLTVRHEDGVSTLEETADAGAVGAA